MAKGDGPDQFVGNIPGAAVTDGLNYYIEAFDADGAQSGRAGSKVAPYSVKMDDEIVAPPAAQEGRDTK